MTTPKLLLVDDDEDIRVQMKWALADGYDVVAADDRTSAMAAFASERPLATLLDLGLPPSPNDPVEGLATLSGFLTLDRLAKVIVVSGQGERQNALRAVGAGAYDFLSKPVDMDEPTKRVLSRAVYVAQLEREDRALEEASLPEAFEDMLGTSPQMQAVFAFVRKVATTSAPVLILAENGTGKEMVARALHRRGHLRSGSFVPNDCNAIPENLLESELFGHEKGSFTGAHALRRAVETAAGARLPRRNRRTPGYAPGQAPSLPSGEDLSAGRGSPRNPERRASDRRRHQPQPAGGGSQRQVPGGLGLPPCGIGRQPASAAPAGR